jgi:hypothetical protein
MDADEFFFSLIQVIWHINIFSHYFIKIDTFIVYGTFFLS